MTTASRETNEDEHPPTRTTERLTNVARRDPIVWSRSAAGPLSESELLFYDLHGYLVLPSFVDRRHVALLRNEAETLRTRRGDKPLGVLQEDGVSALRAVTGVHRDTGPFQALMEHPGIVGVTRQILADDIYVLDSRIEYKVPFDGRGRPWRADFDAWQRQRALASMRALTIRLFLTSNRACNGPLMVIPGSHRVSVPCVGTTSDVTSRAPDRDALTALERTHGIDVITGGPGTVVFLDANLLYASSDNPSPLERITLYCAFNAKSNVPHPKT